MSNRGMLNQLHIVTYLPHRHLGSSNKHIKRVELVMLIFDLRMHI